SRPGCPRAGGGRGSSRRRGGSWTQSWSGGRNDRVGISPLGPVLAPFTTGWTSYAPLTPHSPIVLETQRDTLRVPAPVPGVTGEFLPVDPGEAVRIVAPGRIVVVVRR